MEHTLTLSDRQLDEARMIVADADGTQALRFLKEAVVKPLDRLAAKALDPAKGAGRR